MSPVKYATIGITWDGPQDPPWQYLSSAQNALTHFDAAVAWPELTLEPENESDDYDGGPDYERVVL